MTQTRIRKPRAPRRPADDILDQIDALTDSVSRPVTPEPEAITPEVTTEPEQAADDLIPAEIANMTYDHAAARERLESAGRLMPRVETGGTANMRSGDTREDEDGNLETDELAGKVRVLATKISANAWKLGDLLAAEIPTGSLAALAAAADVPENTLRAHRKVSLAWPTAEGRPWRHSVAEILAPLEDRYALATRKPDMSVREAREIVKTRRQAEAGRAIMLDAADAPVEIDALAVERAAIAAAVAVTATATRALRKLLQLDPEVIRSLPEWHALTAHVGQS